MFAGKVETRAEEKASRIFAIHSYPWDPAIDYRERCPNLNRVSLAAIVPSALVLADLVNVREYWPGVEILCARIADLQSLLCACPATAVVSQVMADSRVFHCHLARAKGSSS
jgi:hypothetical protein